MDNQLTVRKEGIWSRFINYFKTRIFKERNQNQNNDELQQRINDVENNSEIKSKIESVNRTSIEPNSIGDINNVQESEFDKVYSQYATEINEKQKEIEQKRAMFDIKIEQMKRGINENINIQGDVNVRKNIDNTVEKEIENYRKSFTTLSEEELDNKFKNIDHYDFSKFSDLSGYLEKESDTVRVGSKDVSKVMFNYQNGYGQKYKNIQDNKECIMLNQGGNQVQIINLKNGSKLNDYERPDLKQQFVKEKDEDGIITTTEMGAVIDADYNKHGDYKITSKYNPDGSRMSYEEIKDVVDENGKETQVVKTNEFFENSMRQTRIVDGKVVYQLDQLEDKAVIKECDENGNFTKMYVYGEDGKLDYSVKLLPNGEKEIGHDTYKGIDTVPSYTEYQESIKNDLSNNYRMTDNHMYDYIETLDSIGEPKVNGENLYLDAININEEIEEFNKAKSQIKNRDIENQEKKRQEKDNANDRDL